MINSYDIGEKLKIVGTFKHEGDLADPVEVRGLYKNPAGILITLRYSDGGIVKESQGVYSFEINMNLSGSWCYRMDDGGTNIAAEGHFRVKTSPIV